MQEKTFIFLLRNVKIGIDSFKDYFILKALKYFPKIFHFILRGKCESRFHFDNCSQTSLGKGFIIDGLSK